MESNRRSEKSELGFSSNVKEDDRACCSANFGYEGDGGAEEISCARFICWNDVVSYTILGGGSSNHLPFMRMYEPSEASFGGPESFGEARYPLGN